MEEDFFQRNDFLCEMALQNQFNYCLKIRKLKLRVTIQKLEPILYELSLFQKYDGSSAREGMFKILFECCIDFCP